MPQPTCLVWFKSDLRVRDNPALYAATTATTAASSASNLPVIALFLINVAEWALHDMAPLRADFILRNLECLKHELAKLHIPLIVRVVEPDDDAADHIEDRHHPVAAPTAVLEVARRVHARHVFFNREFEVDETRRDKVTQHMLEADGRTVHTFQDQCVMDPGSVRTKEGKVYKVYSMFRTTWITHVVRDRMWDKVIPDPRPNPKGACGAGSAVAAYLARWSEVPTQLAGDVLRVDPAQAILARTHFPAGEAEAHARLATFLVDRSPTYTTHRDLVAQAGTSSLSPYLSSGILTTRQALHAAMRANNGRIEGGSPGIAKWISELVWREFYRHILVAFPHVCKHQPFKPEYKNVPWLNDPLAFDAWTRGRTGYPIVDAGMRQLNTLGWMHNRCRMITAMFLTKHLLHDWRRGERYFMQHLIDGDFANNNGGWQWSASSGVDPQPYFRIFNPLLQSQKCDPDGTYIRHWVPELTHLHGKALHNPYAELPAAEFARLGYPAPIVDHKFARARCLKAFKTALGKV
ncbi:deoxyribodipyrimidine photolyase [Powellomyces hirtus]|nr:deoxyribodipyrimidine photolyase [Powellomyces hirtus]